MELARYVGWLLTLACVMMAVSHVTKALIVLVWKEASELRQVSGDDAIRALIRECGDFFSLLHQRKLATVCSVASLTSLLWLGVDGYAAFGYAAITFVIAGLATPLALQYFRPLVSKVARVNVRNS